MKQEGGFALKKEDKVIEDNYTKTIHIEGVGTITEVGQLDLEKLIRNLLKNKYITGEKEYEKR
jgi:hypothetical protein